MCSIMGFTSEKLTAKIVCPFFGPGPSPGGPDRSRMEKAGSGYLCFHRLSIMGLTDEGMQPFHLGEVGSLQRRALRLPCLEKEALPPVLLPQRFRL